MVPSWSFLGALSPIAQQKARLVSLLAPALEEKKVHSDLFASGLYTLLLA
jgi:hypothetical protein